MTLQEILNAHRGYLERQYNEWRRTRWLGTILANVFGSGKKKIMPTDLMKLPGDEGGFDLAEEMEKIKEMRKWLMQQ